jgi:hypothetical protein
MCDGDEREATPTLFAFPEPFAVEKGEMGGDLGE